MNEAPQELNLHSKNFGEDFIWGAATSATQIEGAANIGGKGASIWDIFSAKKNKIRNNNNPSIACNFYEHYEADLQLMQSMGIKHFRFSIAWSRILPYGIGDINEEGIQFYHNVIDSCIDKNITPWVTLYHWDLPQALQEKGGWCNREILQWFDAYVSICVQHYHTKIKYWMVLNEPMVYTGAGYFLGVHAPGKKGLKHFLPALHHTVLAQKIGYDAIKKIDANAIVGSTFSCSYIVPYSIKEKDVLAAKRIDALLNRLFIEPSLGLGYPYTDLPLLHQLKKYMHNGDERKMKVNFDFIGIQNYTKEVVKHHFFTPYLKAKLVPAHKRKVYHTQLLWEVYPQGIYQMIKKFAAYTSVKKIIITENGASFPDELMDGEIKDTNRKNYLKAYIAQVQKAKQEGLPVHGYFVWSFLDNFEWAEGYHHRFGIVYVDHDTQQRIVKDSGKWYQSFLK
jgi:beta-glucosidase